MWSTMTTDLGGRFGHIEEQRVKRTYFSLAAAAWVGATLLWGPSAAYSSALYWSERANLGGANRIVRADANGGPATTVRALSGPSESFYVDQPGQRLFWSVGGGPSETVRYANLDGSGSESALPRAGGPAFGIAVDAAAGKVYSSVPVTGSLNRYDFATAESRAIFSGSSIILGPSDIALDPVQQRIYWSESFQIMRGSTEGTMLETFVPSDGRFSVLDLDVDPENGYLYWISLGQFPTSVIRRARLDGTAAENVVVAGDEFTRHLAIALDPGGALYWFERPEGGATVLRRSNLDGSGASTLPHIVPTGADKLQFVVPEPSTIALGLVAIVALMVRHRHLSW